MRRLLAIATLALAGWCAGSTIAADLVIGLSADVTSIDPHVLNSSPNMAVAEQIYGVRPQ